MAMTVNSGEEPGHPLFDWNECLVQRDRLEEVLHILGSSLTIKNIDVNGLPSFTLVHPRRVSRLKVNGGGPLEAWEPLDPPITCCVGKPLHDPIWVGRPQFNPLNWEITLLIPLEENLFLHARAKPLNKIIYNEIEFSLQNVFYKFFIDEIKIPHLGKCASKEVFGWHPCERSSISKAHNKLLFTNPLTLETPCFRFRMEILHPGGFVSVNHDWSEAEANAVYLSCPRVRFYIVSPFGFKVRTLGKGRIQVEPSGVALIGVGERLAAIKSLASLIPPKIDSIWSFLRGSPLCMISYSSDNRVRISAWNPVENDSYCEILFREKVARIKIIDPIGETSVEAERGVVRVPLPSYVWINVEAEKDVSLVEKLKKLKSVKR